MKTVGLYKLLLNQKLGQGTLGKSFKVIHDITQQTAVMRVIPKNKFYQSKHVKETLKSEIKYFSKIQAENLAAFIDVLQTGNNFYILRQYCPDGSLRDLMDKNATIPEKQVKNILVQLLKAMFELIQKGIIHKNLIPENILFKKQVLKLSDFGIQKINNQVFQSQIIHTRFQYKSPELLDGAKGNFKCDVWALGIILYQMLYGKHPWTCTSEQLLKNSISKQKLQFPSNIQVSKGMKKFIMSCLMVDANERAEWSQIFQSNLMEGQNIPQLNNLNQKYSMILSIFKSNIIASNLDVQRYFQSKNISSNDVLSHKAFNALIKPMAPQLTDQQIDFIYVKLDTNADDQLQLRQFEQAMKDFEIPLQGTYRRKAQKLLKGKDVDKQLEQQQKRQSQLSFIYQGLIQNLAKKQIYDLFELFTESDKQKIGILQFRQFIDLLRKIDKTITKTQCEKVFIAFDKNEDKKISFNQFFANMCKITGSLNGLPNN